MSSNVPNAPATEDGQLLIVSRFFTKRGKAARISERKTSLDAKLNCNPIEDLRGLWCKFPKFSRTPLPAAESADTTLEVLERAAEIKSIV